MRELDGCGVWPWGQERGRRAAAAAMASERAKLEEAALPLMLDAMWAANVLDIQHTVKAICQEVPPLLRSCTSLCLEAALATATSTP